MGLQNTDMQSLVFLILFSFLSLLSFSGSVDAYKNYTVGDSLGWYDNIEKPNVDYQKWASTKNFSLGDFLSKYIQEIHFLCVRALLFLFFTAAADLTLYASLKQSERYRWSKQGKDFPVWFGFL